MADIKRVAHMATGWSLYATWCWILDNPLWIFVIGWFGLLGGSLIMTLFAMINNFIFLLFYQNQKTSWLGANGLTILKEEGHNWAQKVHEHKNHFVKIFFWVPAYFFKLLVSCARKNNILAFFVLSIETDSFITTAFLRGEVEGKLKNKDYYIFIGSTLISCLYWSLRNGVILIFLKSVWGIGKQFL